MENMALMKTYKHLLISTRSHLRIITLNRPKSKNAINTEMYDEIVCALNEAANDDNIVITAITGAGDYYCSGNDLRNFNDAGGDLGETIKKASSNLQKFVQTFFEFPKILAALVNGPAIGIAVTTLGLFDVVYASDRASEILYFNKKFTAQEAKECRLVTEVIPHDKLDRVLPELEKLSNLPSNSLLYSKALVRNQEKENLQKAVEAECKRLEERWQSEDCLNAVIAFMSRKNKL
ncbi:Peroxisomal 3,2-trans-enoyl-CoA isomerase [Gryllus bimaculatus]|nr:Peroxisomal 3,2-trans-enoyl-CoA isomerase [Gryllus bimaculatus]